MRRVSVAALIVAAFAAAVDARPVIVHVTSTTCTTATLRAMSTGDMTIERRWSGADVSFDLGEGAWTIGAEAPGCWAPAADIGVGAVNITLWPAATLRFHVEDHSDAAIQVRLASADGKIAPAVTSCAHAGSLWTCSVPATPLDLRIAAEGYVPQYIWGKDIARRAVVDLGTVRLTRGASVSGRVTLPLKQPNLDGITVQLAPAALADSGRAALLTQTVKTNGRGFFQFGAVDEGTYTVVARMSGWSPANASDVRVVAGAEVALGKPLDLTPLAKLEVLVDPPGLAGGKPWHITMVRSPPAVANAAEVVHAITSPAGEWSRPQLEAGLYDLSIGDAAGSIVHRQLVEIREGMPPLRISIDSFRVRGRVTFRGEPLECGISFAHPMNASANIRLRSDTDGRFETMLPEEGTWKVQLALAQGYAQLQPREIRRPADGAPVDLDLVLPSGRIRGKTVDENGDPVPAYVAVLQNGKYAASIMASDGRFDLIGVEPADVMIHASNSALDRDGGLVPHRVAEDSDDPITIPVPKRRKMKAWLVTPAGQPIAGALVRYVSAGNVAEEVSGPAGELVLPLPEGERSVPLVILSLGLPKKIMLFAAGPEASEIVVSSVAARLLLQHTPRNYWIAHDGAVFHGSFLFEPSSGGRPREATSNGFALDFEPGSYAICATPSRERCKTFMLQAGTTTTVDVSEIVAR